MGQGMECPSEGLQVTSIKSLKLEAPVEDKALTGEGEARQGQEGRRKKSLVTEHLGFLQLWRNNNLLEEQPGSFGAGNPRRRKGPLLEEWGYREGPKVRILSQTWRYRLLEDCRVTCDGELGAAASNGRMTP